MAVFETKDLVIRTRAVEEGSRGIFLEISFEGVHIHPWPGGSEIQAFVECEIRAAAPAAYLFDFLGYDYPFGDEIAGAIVGVLRYGGVPFPPIALVAQGGTLLSLECLFDSYGLERLPDFSLFEDAASGYAFLRRRLDNRAKPPSPPGN